MNKVIKDLQEVFDKDIIRINQFLNAGDKLISGNLVSFNRAYNIGRREMLQNLYYNGQTKLSKEEFDSIYNELIIQFKSLELKEQQCQK